MKALVALMMLVSVGALADEPTAHDQLCSSLAASAVGYMLTLNTRPFAINVAPAAQVKLQAFVALGCKPEVLAGWLQTNPGAVR